MDLQHATFGPVILQQLESWSGASDFTILVGSQSYSLGSLGARIAYTIGHDYPGAAGLPKVPKQPHSSSVYGLCRYGVEKSIGWIFPRLIIIIVRTIQKRRVSAWVCSIASTSIYEWIKHPDGRSRLVSLHFRIHNQKSPPPKQARRMAQHPWASLIALCSLPKFDWKPYLT